MASSESEIRAAGSSFGSQATRQRLKSLLRVLRRSKVPAAFGFVLLILVVACYGAPLFIPYHPNEKAGTILAAPSFSHLMGTDQFGRDVFTRVLYGGRTSLTVGLVCATLASGGSLLLALLFTYAGGVWEYLWLRYVDAWMALPGLVLLLVLITMLGPSLLTIIGILSLSSMITGTRVIRSKILSVKGEDYVLAANALGAGPFRIAFRHLVPNVVSVSIVTATLGVGGFMLAEAALSFLGLGIRPPTPSWGGMMGVDGRTYIMLAPWMLIGPAIALSLTVMSANMFGDWLRDVLDPRLRGVI